MRMLRFDDFRVELARLQLLRQDVPLDAPAQVVEVLAHLIANRARIVPRQELLERFWPRAGSGGDAALNTCIRRIRSVLDDDAEAPRYIQTRPRAGYRFIGVLQDEAASRDTTAPPSQQPRGLRRFTLAGGVFAALAAGAAVWIAGTLPSTPRRIAVEPVQGLCEYVLFPNFNAGLRESLVARISHDLPAGYSLSEGGAPADLQARVSVRQTPRQTVAVLTLLDSADGRLVWSGEFAATTDMDDYVPLQRSLAERMAASLTRVLGKQS
ncbi:MAG: winged helix-turn-helix domain-containing protein [Xanthomonadaceae bacterium]|nr:winged helix-turn-helix domain-containing protein [Xanthomonadaceae bacterium]